MGRFSTWWSAFPRQVSKEAAAQAWRQLDKKGKLPPVDEMLAKLKVQLRMSDWRRGKVPEPHWYLRNGNYLDVIRRMDVWSDSEKVEMRSMTTNDIHDDPAATRRIG